MFVKHFVKSVVCVYVFVLLTFLNQLFKHWSRGENWKPVVSQVCRQTWCSVFYFCIQTLLLEDLIFFGFWGFHIFFCSNLLLILCFVSLMFEPVEIIIAWQEPNRMYFFLHVTNQRAEVNFFNKPFFFFVRIKVCVAINVRRPSMTEIMTWLIKSCKYTFFIVWFVQSAVV